MYSIYKTTANKSLNLYNVDTKLYHIYETLRAFGWNPKAFPIDNYSWDNRTSRCAENTLSYLIFLDSLQVNTLPYFITRFKNPTAKLAVAEHLAQEAMHVQSYQYILSTYPDDVREKIYYKVETDPVLKRRAEILTKPYQQYVNDPTEENEALALFADYILEGVLFFNGFMPFYALDFPKTQTIISLIHRDENIHTLLFQTFLSRLITNSNVSKPRLVDFAYNVIQIEKRWMQEYLLGDFVEKNITDQHCDYLLNLRLSALGLEPFKNITNPFAYFYKKANFTENGSALTNVLETKASSYVMAETITEGWDIFV